MFVIILPTTHVGSFPPTTSVPSVSPRCLSAPPASSSARTNTPILFRNASYGPRRTSSAWRTNLECAARRSLSIFYYSPSLLSVSLRCLLYPPPPFLRLSTPHTPTTLHSGPRRSFRVRGTPEYFRRGGDPRRAGRGRSPISGGSLSTRMCTRTHV